MFVYFYGCVPLKSYTVNQEKSHTGWDSGVHARVAEEAWGIQHYLQDLAIGLWGIPTAKRVSDIRSAPGVSL